jgi:hypothetical protein
VEGRKNNSPRCYVSEEEKFSRSTALNLAKGEPWSGGAVRLTGKLARDLNLSGGVGERLKTKWGVW